MASLSWRVCALAAGLALVGTAHAAEAVRFAHGRSVYADALGAALHRPEGVACGADGTVVVADTGNGRLVRYTVSGAALDGGTELKIPQATYPVRLHLSSKGEILVLDGKLRQVLRLSAAGQFLAAVEPRGAPGSAIAVYRSFALDREDNVYFLDAFGRRVLVTDPSGAFQRELPFPGSFGFISDLAVDPRGTVFLLDSVAGALYGAEKGSSAFTLLTAELKQYSNFPTHLATDARGGVYAVDQNGAGVLVLGQDGTYRGRQLALGWKEGLVYYPAQLCLTATEEAIIADRENNRVQVFRVIR
ncbi:MAG: NHL repeat-containing protein [Deferrisomatales bacterium]|nr:NHL repeat-containing protein [Deferrisomatales bacterium]